MALNIEKIVDLTSYSGNPAPKLVRDLSIIHEAAEGEIVQYYIALDGLQADKRSVATGIYDKNTDSWSYVNYDDLIWDPPKWRITSRKIDRLGLKAFPGIGACAFYKLAYQAICKLLLPVNTTTQKKTTAPTQTVEWVNEHTLRFSFTDPKDIQYTCYRVVLRCGTYAEEHITYEKTIDIELPIMNGDYIAYSQGYVDEGQAASELSTEFFFTVTGYSDLPPATTEGSDIYLRNTVINDSTGQIAFTLTSGNTSEITIAPYVASQLQILREMIGNLQGSIKITTFKLDTANAGATWDTDNVFIVDNSWKLRDSWSLTNDTVQPLDIGMLATLKINTAQYDAITEVTIHD